MQPTTALRGDVLRPEDPDYNAARAVFNAMIDRKPLAILRCRQAADVAHGITFAREHDLALSVRGGGHNVAGNAVCDGGIMLDLSPMKDLRVDPDRLRAHAGPGLLLGDLDRATQQHGLAVPLGVMSKTGIAGLTLGGGLGWLNGRYGSACDNLIGAEVVTADGDVLHVSEDEHADLLWGLRGGGLNRDDRSNFSALGQHLAHRIGRRAEIDGALEHPQHGGKPLAQFVGDPINQEGRRPKPLRQSSNPLSIRSLGEKPFRMRISFRSNGAPPGSIAAGSAETGPFTAITAWMR